VVCNFWEPPQATYWTPHYCQLAEQIFSMVMIEQINLAAGIPGAGAKVSDSTGLHTCD